MPDTATLSEVAALESELERLETYQYAAAMSDSRYYTNGRKARDDAEIRNVRARLNAAKALTK
ncbi:hypothetical protein [Ensifer sp. LCM 4579]|uniref:hypothetical protein n=1 Tax=Ensifer sp. LCM 4579 TaxID=1848292 RepID=UPI0008D91D1C|nr:hypothetical protein [Ensifer sp. LCM 4579]OHV73356.1 hypothetical protein LCM4579_10570 [Ensifer sp. LCM 4579]